MASIESRCVEVRGESLWPLGTAALLIVGQKDVLWDETIYSFHSFICCEISFNSFFFFFFQVNLLAQMFIPSGIKGDYLTCDWALVTPVLFLSLAVHAPFSVFFYF